MRDSTLLIILGLIIIFLIILENLNKDNDKEEKNTNFFYSGDINFPNWWPTASSFFYVKTTPEVHNTFYHKVLGPGGTQNILGPGGTQKQHLLGPGGTRK